MFNRISGGSEVEIKGYKVQLPPVGYGVDPRNGKVEYIGVTDFGENADDRYYKRVPKPKWYNRALAEQTKVQKSNEDYIHPDLEEYRQREWLHRDYGQWFINGDTHTYITGAHWLYLNHWYMGEPKYPDYREPDREFFYVASWTIENPKIFGMIFTTKRREGKTAKSAVLAYWFVSGEESVNCGIQSKTDDDAVEAVFQQAIFRAHKRMPAHFKPMRKDENRKGIPSTLHFINDKWKGEDDVEPGLDSKIVPKASTLTGFDGWKLRVYIGDEVFKTTTCSVVERHDIHLECCKVDDQPWGFMIYTSTVEEIEGHIEEYIELWEDADYSKAENGYTSNGLIQYFTPSDECATPGFVDKYGRVNKAAQRESILRERELVRDNTKRLHGMMRRRPLDPREAFRAAAGGSMYDAAKINDRLDQLTFMDAPCKRGKFMWKDDIKDSVPVFYEQENGPWLVHEAALEPEARFERSLRETNGGYRLISQSVKAVLGVDPYDHDKVQREDLASDGAGAVFIRQNDDERLRNNFAAIYCDRPKTKELFYEQMLLAARFFEAGVFIENQKKAILDYAKARGYYNSFCRLPGRKEVGIASSVNTKQELAEATESFIANECPRVAFAPLLKDWNAFDITKTQLYDLSMASGWALVLASKLNAKFAAKEKRKASGTSSAASILKRFRR